MSQYTLQEVKWVEMDESELDVDWAEKKSTVPISGFGWKIFKFFFREKRIHHIPKKVKVSISVHYKLLFNEIKFSWSL